MFCTTLRIYLNNYAYWFSCLYHWALPHPAHPGRGRVPRFGRSRHQRRWLAVQAEQGSSSHNWLCECDQSALQWAAHCAGARCKLCGLTGDRKCHQLLHQLIGLDLKGKSINFTHESMCALHGKYFSGWNYASLGCTGVVWVLFICHF